MSWSARRGRSVRRLLRPSRGVVAAFLIAAGYGGAVAGDANLDPTFGTGGFVLSGTAGLRVSDFALLPDGRVIGVGRGGTPSGGMVCRFDADWTLDATFGATGCVTLGLAPSPYGDVSASGLAAVDVAPDGKLVIAAPGNVRGLGSGESNPVSLVYRLDPNGVPDPMFGDNGRVIINLLPSGSGPTPREESLSDVAVQPDGRIVAAGRCSGAPACEGENFGAMVIRLLPDGALDPSFGGDGVINTAVASTIMAHVVDLLPDGRILVAGLAAIRGVMFRLLPDGTLDSSFGEFYDSCYYTSRPAAECTGYAVRSAAISTTRGIAGLARDSLDRIVVAGKTELPDDHDEFVVERYSSDGVLDTAFGTGGVAQHATASNVTVNIGAMALTPAGRILVIGVTQSQGGDDPGIALLRLTSDGAPDSSFTPNGFARLDLPGGYTTGTAILPLPDGERTLIAGSYSPVDYRWQYEGFVARLGGLCGNGTIDPAEECDDGNSLGFDCCSSGCQLDPPGAGCDVDGRLCTYDTCDGAGACSAGGPAPICRAVTVPLSSNLKIVRRSTGDVFRWKWRHGEWTDVDEFGFPEYLTRFTMCFYAGSSVTGEIEFPIGDGWRYVPDDISPKGLKYGGKSTPIRSVRLTGGYQIESSIRVTGKGVGTGLPSLPLSMPMSMQLLNDRGECWGAQYDEARVNTGSKFSADGD